MNGDWLLRLQGHGEGAGAAWVLVLALLVKVLSTAWGWWRLRQAPHAPVPAAPWWASKLSALVACGAALRLSLAAGDRRGAVVFAVLLALASLVVAVLARRRQRQVAHPAR